MKALVPLCLACCWAAVRCSTSATPPAPAAAPAPGPPRRWTPTARRSQRVPFRLGVSSVTVEKLARAAGLHGGQGAGLVTEQGPVEVYRMQCDNGKVFMARCEMRQCRKM
jgi:hypothetical protein